MTSAQARPGTGTVADAMLSIPRTHSPAVTVREMAAFFEDDHVHAALIVSPAGQLMAVVERGDLADASPPGALALRFGRLAGRTVPPEASLAETRQAMIDGGCRRAAVIDADGQLLGLLCLKASRAGFCSDRDVLNRAAEPRPSS
jgi:CBS domain-containing protein